MATKQLGTDPDRPEDTATNESVETALVEQPDAGSAAQAQSLRDTLFAGLAGESVVTESTNPQLLLALKNISPGNIVGVLGAANIGDAVQLVVEALAGEGAGLADLRLWAKTVQTQAAQGAAETTAHEPETHFLSAGEQVAVPSWADYVDLLPVGEGGKSSPDIPPVGRYSQPGTPGNVNKTTLQRTEHYTGTPNVTCAGASLTLNGHTITATDGVDGSGTTTTLPVGHAPENFTFKDVPYEFGGDQEALGADGTAPGGAASGRHWLLGRLRPDGQGGPAGGFVTFRADAVPDEEVEEPEGDTTPPNIDDLDVGVVATTTTLTLTITGAVDE